MQHEFAQFLSRLTKELDLEENLSLDESNQCFLLFDDKILVRIELRNEPNCFSLVSKLGNVEEKNIPEMYPRLLESNVLWKETNGTTFGVQQFSEMVLLTQHYPLERCSYENFEKALENFVNTTEYWLNNFESLQKKTAKGSSGEKSSLAGIKV